MGLDLMARFETGNQGRPDFLFGTGLDLPETQGKGHLPTFQFMSHGPGERSHALFDSGGAGDFESFSAVVLVESPE